MSVQPQLRQPRSIVKVQGQSLPGWIEWEVDNNTHQSADTFRVTFACAYLPAARNKKWLTSAGRIQVEVFVGFPQDSDHYDEADLKSLIIGFADAIKYDPVQNTIELAGRDLLSELIDTKKSEKFTNQKSSEIVKTVASRHGLKADVSDLDKKEGVIYEIDYARLNNAGSELDLISEISDRHNCKFWMEGKTLKVESAERSTDTYKIEWISPSDSNPYPISNIIDLNFSRNGMLGKAAINVKVRGYNAKQKLTFTHTATARKKKGEAIDPSDELNYDYIETGCDQEQVRKSARNKLRNIIGNEMVLSATLPGDNMLSTRMKVLVSGTDTAFDQEYFPTSISRRFSFSDGYKMSLEAKNSSEETETED